MIKDFEDMQKLGQSNVDSAMRMFGDWNMNWQAIAAEMGEYTRRLFDEGNTALEKIMASKSVEQAVQIQMNYVKRAFDDYIQLMTNIGGMYAKIALETYELMGSRSLKFSAINSSSKAVRATSP